MSRLLYLAIESRLEHRKNNKSWRCWDSDKKRSDNLATLRQDTRLNFALKRFYLEYSVHTLHNKSVAGRQTVMIISCRCFGIFGSRLPIKAGFGNALGTRAAPVWRRIPELSWNKFNDGWALRCDWPESMNFILMWFTKMCSFLCRFTTECRRHSCAKFFTSSIEI